MLIGELALARTKPATTPAMLLFPLLLMSVRDEDDDEDEDDMDDVSLLLLAF